MNHAVRERVYARGTWTSWTALHIGGENSDFDDAADLVMVRDPSGTPYIPAASLAGACRNWLSRALEETEAYRKRDEPALLHVLFGDNFQSLLTVFDAPLKGQPQVMVRDGVRIDLSSGVAEDQKKYDFEVLPAGTEFEIEFSLVLYTELPRYRNGNGEPQTVSSESIKSCFRLLLDSIQRGDLRLGAKTRRGLGCGRVDQWDIRCLEMTQREALAAWLSHNPYAYPASNVEDLGESLKLYENPSFSITAKFALDSSLLVRSSGEHANSPEFSHLSENGKALLTGTTLTGALRSRAEQIANTIIRSENAGGARDGAGKTLVEKIFGYVHENDPRNPARASRLRVSEVTLPGGRDHLHVQGRVSIDRFTGGALETALFDEAAYWPRPDDPDFTVSMCLEDPEPGEIGLLLLVFKDLCLGDLPVGGEKSGGRGVLSGREATISRTGFTPVQLVFNNGMTTDMNGNKSAWMNDCVSETWRQLTHV